jgi:hypothetical protein
LSQSTVAPSVDVEAAVDVLESLYKRAPMVQNARFELRRLGLDKRYSSDKSALELLDDAERGVNMDHDAGLISLRESIDAAVAALNRRKPQQESTGGTIGARLISMFRHECGRPGLTETHFTRLGDQLDAHWAKSPPRCGRWARRRGR